MASFQPDIFKRFTIELESERAKNMELMDMVKEQRAKNAELEEIIEKMAKPAIPRISSWSSIASTAPDVDIGIYSREIRSEKIQKYKEKIQRYRAKVKLSRDFRGRSEIAKNKPRVNGKFIKLNKSE